MSNAVLAASSSRFLNGDYQVRLLRRTGFTDSGFEARMNA
jgi:hypothetical protein